MKTLKFVGLLILLPLISIPAYAQHRFNSEEMAKRQSQNVIKNIPSLTQAQKDSVQTIFAKYAKLTQDAWQNNSGDRQAMRSQMQKLRSDRDAELKALFTKDQYQQYQKLMEKNRRRFRQHQRQ